MTQRPNVGDTGTDEALLRARLAATRRQAELRADVVSARNKVERVAGPARRFRYLTRACSFGIVVGGLGVTYCVVAAALSAWVDFGPTAVLATLVLSAVVLLGSIVALVVVTSDAQVDGETPTDLLRTARHRFDEAYAAYLDTAPVNTADAYLRPRTGGRRDR